MGSALMGSLQFLCFLDRGTFWVLPLTYFYLPKSARAYLFPQSLKIRQASKGESAKTAPRGLSAPVQPNLSNTLQAAPLFILLLLIIISIRVSVTTIMF